MKKKFIFCLVLFLPLLSSTETRAGSIDYLINESADWARTFSRNAATDATDAVHYNPAGTAMMQDGIYVSLHNQVFLKNYNMSVTNPTSVAAGSGSNAGSYKSDLSTPFLPSIFAVYKKDDLALFAAFTVPAGGGSVDYKDGVPFFMSLPVAMGAASGKTINLVPNSSSFEATSFFPAVSAGAAYRVLPFLSISAGGRYVYGYKSYNGDATFYNSTDSLFMFPAIDSKKTAHGFSGIFGINATPVQGLNLAVRYEMETYLNWKTRTKTFNYLSYSGALTQFKNGYKEKRPLPALLGVGVSYDILQMVRVSGSFTYYFIKQADKYTDVKTPAALAQVKGYDDDYDNGYEIGSAIEYIGLQNWIFSAGYSYSDTGANKNTLSDFDVTLDSHTVCAGLKRQFQGPLSFTLGVARSFYVDASAPYLVVGKETWEKDVWTIAISIEYKLPLSDEGKPEIITE